MSLKMSTSENSDIPASQTDRPLKILVTGAHPGDQEYACGGTILRYAAAGHDVAVLYMNRGEGGLPNGTAEEAASVRSAEAAAACKLMGARPLFATQVDGHGEFTAARRKEYLELVAAEAPDIIFAHWPIDNHPDHVVNSALAHEAWRWLGCAFEFYYYEVSNGEDTLHFTPTHYVDISEQEAAKRAACFTHASQSPEHFYGIQEKVSRFRGLECGVDHAEAFIRHILSPGPGLPGLSPTRRPLS